MEKIIGIVCEKLGIPVLVLTLIVAVIILIGERIKSDYPPVDTDVYTMGYS